MSIGGLVTQPGLLAKPQLQQFTYFAITLPRDGRYMTEQVPVVMINPPYTYLTSQRVPNIIALPAPSRRVVPQQVTCRLAPTIPTIGPRWSKRVKRSAHKRQRSPRQYSGGLWGRREVPEGGPGMSLLSGATGPASGQRVQVAAGHN